VWREPRAWVLVAICVIVPVALLVIALNSGDGGGSDDRSVTVNTKPGDGLAPERAVTEGERAPTFQLRTLDGQPLDTASYRGKPYVLTFWGSWCIPCRKEMPLLQDAYDEHAGELPVVGVTYQDPESDSRAFAREYGITFPLAADDGYKVAKAFGVMNGVPQTFFVGADGVVTARVAGIEKRSELDKPLATLNP
jgi:peroxiredoxin